MRSSGKKGRRDTRNMQKFFLHCKVARQEMADAGSPKNEHESNLILFFFFKGLLVVSEKSQTR